MSNVEKVLSLSEKIELGKHRALQLQKKHIHIEGGVIFDNSDDMAEAVFSNQMAMDYTPNAFNTVSNGVPQAAVTAWVKDIIRPVSREYTYDKIGADFQQGDFATVIMQLPTLAFAGFMDTYVPGYDGAGAGAPNANLNYVQRNIEKLQIFLSYDDLEEATMASVKINILNEKRTAMMNVIEQTRDDIFWYGLSYNPGVRGLVNDSNLNAVITLPASAANPASSGWEYKTFQEKQNDILIMFNQLVVNMVNNVKVSGVSYASSMQLILAPTVLSYFVKQNDFEASLSKWFKETFPNCEIITAVQEYGATGSGDNLMTFALKTYQGIPTICHGYSYLFRAFRVVQGTDYWKQKYSIGDAGAVNRMPVCIVQSIGS